MTYSRAQKKAASILNYQMQPLNYITLTVHGTLPHSFWNLWSSSEISVTSEYFRMYPYLNVSGWKCILTFFHSLSGLRYENLDFYCECSNHLPKILLLQTPSLCLCLNTLCLWVNLLISPFRKYKVGCFWLIIYHYIFSLGRDSYRFGWTVPFPYWNLLDLNTITSKKNLIVISHSRNPDFYQ